MFRNFSFLASQLVVLAPLSISNVPCLEARPNPVHSDDDAAFEAIIEVAVPNTSHIRGTDHRRSI